MKGNQPSLLLRYPMRSHLWRTTYFSEPSSEVGNLQRVCAAHIFLTFFPWIHSAHKSSRAHLASADWRATQPTPSRQNFMNCQFRSVFLHCRTTCSFEFKLDFWKRVHDLKNQFDSSRKCRSKVSVTTAWENHFEEGLRFSLGRILLLLWLF